MLSGPFLPIHRIFPADHRSTLIPTFHARQAPTDPSRLACTDMPCHRVWVSEPRFSVPLRYVCLCVYIVIVHCIDLL